LAQIQFVKDSRWSWG